MAKVEKKEYSYDFPCKSKSDFEFTAKLIHAHVDYIKVKLEHGKMLCVNEFYDTMCIKRNKDGFIYGWEKAEDFRAEVEEDKKNLHVILTFSAKKL